MDGIDKIASLDNIEAAVDDSLRNRSKRNALTKDSIRFLKGKEPFTARVIEKRTKDGKTVYMFA